MSTAFDELREAGLSVSASCELVGRSRATHYRLTDLGVTRSHSRPKVSNDNRFGESQPKTPKCIPNFPDHFESIAPARDFCAGFFMDTTRSIAIRA